MTIPSLPLTLLVLIGVASPAVLLALLGATSLLNRPIPERWIGKLAAGWAKTHGICARRESAPATIAEINKLERIHFSVI